MRTSKRLLIFVMLLLFLAGLGILAYPHIQGFFAEVQIAQDTQTFLERVEELPSPTRPSSTIQKNEPYIPFAELLEEMTAYNQRIWEERQTGLCDPWSYEQPSFTLGDYGLEDEVFAVVSIPKLNLTMPVYLGATYENMAAGAAHLSQTSLPIGGSNANCVIAGHRGWNGAAYFRYITDLQLGDDVVITNIWETLTYKVVGTTIIAPDAVDEILIHEGKDMLTLLTCHPYGSGGKQRFLVFCERSFPNE